MSEDLATLTKQVHGAIESKRPSQDCTDISEQLVLALVSDPKSDELKALNYRWQTYVSKEYVREHRIDEFLDNLVRHVLVKKPENPLEEMYASLSSSKLGANAAPSTSSPTS